MAGMPGLTLLPARAQHHATNTTSSAAMWRAEGWRTAQCLQAQAPPSQLMDKKKKDLTELS